MLLQELIETFEELKKYIFVVNRGNKPSLIIKFDNNNFYHLVGFHKMNFDLFFPNSIKSKAKKYKYMKNHVKKFNNILLNQTKEKDLLELRITTFKNILDLLKSNYKIALYNLKITPPGSLYNGDYGLLKKYENINCLLGLKEKNKDNNTINCVPQSWMASKRINKLVEFKKPIFMESIIAIPLTKYNNPKIDV